MSENNAPEAFEFSSSTKRQALTIDGQAYEIREMTFDDRSRYLKAQGKTMEVRMIGTGEKDSRGVEVLRREIKMLDLSSTQRELLMCSLYKIGPDGSATPVKAADIGRFGALLVEKLSNIAHEVNGMSRTEEELQAEAEGN